MQPRRFVGFSCNVGDPMTFKVLQCNTNPHQRNVVVHRSVVTPRNSAEIGYNYSLAPKSDDYFLEVSLEDAPPIKPTTPEQQVTLDPPNIAISEGGSKWHNP